MIYFSLRISRLDIELGIGAGNEMGRTAFEYYHTGNLARGDLFWIEETARKSTKKDKRKLR